MGELRKRGRIWWIRYYRNGLRHEESSRSTRKGAAIDLLKIREGDIARGVPVSAKVGQLRFDEAAADVLTDYKVNGKRSLRHVEGRIRLHLEPFFGGRRMSSITTSGVRRYTAARQDGGAANATVNRELEILKRAFRLAQQAGKLLHRPFVPRLREDNVRPGFFERDQFDDVRLNLPKELQGLVTFLFLTGWRSGEVLPLQWSQIDRQAQTIRLEPGTTKNMDGRTLPYGLLPELEEAIEAQWNEHERLAAAGRISPWVFVRSNGDPIKDVRKAWKSACTAAGLPGVLIHDFRRTAVRNLVRAGVPDTVAMKLTGHKTRSVFDRYNVTSEADLREAIGKLATVAGTKKGQSGNSGRVRQILYQP